MTAEQRTELFQLPDGRRLAFRKFGHPEGFPVVFNHGFPGSRLDAGLFEKAAVSRGVNLIAADRPGSGYSDYQDNRSVEDWSSDLEALADHLQLDRFALLGMSGGGPYALSAAAALGHRITRLALVCALGSPHDGGFPSGMSPLQHAAMEAARVIPHTAVAINTWITGPLIKHFPASVLHLFATTAPPADRTVLAEPLVRDILLASMREAFRQGSRGAAWEMHLITRNRNIDITAIRTPTLLWHGEADNTVPPAFGRRHAAAIPRCEARFIPDEGHFSLPFRYADEILRTLIAP